MCLRRHANRPAMRCGAMRCQAAPALFSTPVELSLNDYYFVFFACAASCSVVESARLHRTASRTTSNTCCTCNARKNTRTPMRPIIVMIISRETRGERERETDTRAGCFVNINIFVYSLWVVGVGVVGVCVVVRRCALSSVV